MQLYLFIFLVGSFINQPNSGQLHNQKINSVYNQPVLKDSIPVIADKGFLKSGTKRWFLGNHYRKEWLTPVRVQQVNLDTLYGGMTARKEGGGKQTRSLRLDFDSVKEKQMVIRSMEKFPDRALPPELVGSAVSYFAKDQITTSHPYGALVVPPLATAAGIYHTNPKIVYLEHSSRLKQYDSLYGGRLYILEERAHGNWSQAPNFGYSSNIISTEDLLKELLKNAGNIVDQRSFLRARLLDILIGDWDRHEEQWDWASFSEDNKTIYRPIPKDRDQAFAKLDGVAPWIATRKWFLRRIKNFDYTISDVEGLSFQARNLDRLLLNTLEWQDWQKEVTFVQSVWTNELLDSAVKKLPPELYPFSGEDIKHKLQKRRDDLVKYAHQYYQALAKEVRWVGTNDRDEFVVNTVSDSVFSIQQWRRKKDTSLLVRQRIFTSKETKEIQLYGMQDDDVFRVTGKYHLSARIRWIGGEGTNQYLDQRSAPKGKRILLYDSSSQSVVSKGQLTTKKRFDSSTHKYRYLDYNYSVVAPVLLPGYNTDDGVLLGGGVLWRKRGWGHELFAQEHYLAANHAFNTGAYNFLYSGIFRKAIGSWDLLIKGEVNQPNYVLNFYGLGNNTELPAESKSFNKVRVKQLILSSGVQKVIAKKHTVSLLGEFYSTKVEDWDGRFVSASNPLIDSSNFSRVHWYGATGNYTFSSLNDRFFPTRGIEWKNSLHYAYSFGKDRYWFNSLSSISAYLPLGKLVFTSRIGGAVLYGKPQFFQYNQLSGLENLRGYRRSRFSGKSMVYNNNELRLPLADLNGYIFRGKIGLSAFTDDGRVWMPEEQSSTWHVGYGGGLWYIPYNRLSFTATYARSQEGNTVLVKTGFLF
jgi:hypothetical protein